MADDFDQIYETYGPMVFRRCQKLLGSDAQASEAMQDTFVRFLTYANGDKTNGVSSLLYRIATNVCLNLIRTRRRRPAETESLDVLLEIADRADAESRVVARDFVTRLFGMDQDSTARMAIHFFYDEMTLAEIAAESNLSVSGVRKRLRKFGMNLRKLEEEHVTQR